MIDELMLRDLQNILDKLQVIKEQDNYIDLLKKLGISPVASEDEINQGLVRYLMSQKEQRLYQKYLLYKQIMDISYINSALTYLEQITSSISVHYESRSQNERTIKSIKEEQSKIESALRDVPMIRINTEYNKVKTSYDRYSSAFIRSGMDRYDFIERIESIERSSVLSKVLTSRKLKKIQKELDVFNDDVRRKLNLLHSGYLIEQSKYGSYLRTLMKSMFEKNRILYNAALLSLISIEGTNIQTITLPSGLVVIDTKKEIDITPEEVSDIIFRYFQKKDIPEFNAETFLTCFKEFLMHFYNKEIERLTNENHESLIAVKTNFDTQKELIEQMSVAKTSISIPRTNQTHKERDTFALIYSNNRHNK